MSPLRPIRILIPLVCALALGAVAEEPPVRSGPAEAEGPQIVLPRPDREFATAVETILEAEAVALEALQARLAAAKDGATSLSIQREIDLRKQETELALMGAQVDRALRRGESELVVELRKHVEQLGERLEVARARHLQLQRR